jgi:hypothetical protein
LDSLPQRDSDPMNQILKVGGSGRELTLATNLDQNSDLARINITGDCAGEWMRWAGMGIVEHD